MALAMEATSISEKLLAVPFYLSLTFEETGWHGPGQIAMPGKSEKASDFGKKSGGEQQQDSAMCES